jgi:hypothetical protein
MRTESSLRFLAMGALKKAQEFSIQMRHCHSIFVIQTRHSLADWSASSITAAITVMIRIIADCDRKHPFDEPLIELEKSYCHHARADKQEPHDYRNLRWGVRVHPH